MIKGFVDKIPNNSRIAIWGAGFAGIGLKKYIDENRKDISVLCFFDIKKTGNECGVPVYNSCDLYNYKDSVDMILLATCNTASYNIGFLNFIEKPFLIIPFELQQYFRNEHFFPLHKKAREVFEYEEDKALYDLIWDGRVNQQNDKIYNYTKEKFATLRPHIYADFSKQYLDFINKDVIKNVLDAGFFNGMNALFFNKNFKNLNNYFGFEPLYETFKSQQYDYFIKNNPKIKIIKKGLGDVECKSYFAKNSSCSRVINDPSELRPKEELETIEITTIDSVKKQYSEKIDFIKMDVEGYEQKALRGGMETFIKDRPQMAISIYHSHDDFLNIPLYLKENLKNYVFRLEHYSFSYSETVLYAIPKELYKG